MPLEKSKAEVLARFSCHMGLLYLHAANNETGNFAFFDEKQIVKSECEFQNMEWHHAMAVVEEVSH